MRRLEREQEIAAVAELEKNMVSVHVGEFAAAQPGTAPPPEPVVRRALLKDHRQRELEGIPFFKRADRKLAKERAAEQAEQAASAEEARRSSEQQARQAELDSTWAALRANDPETVLQMLETAFADNEAPAAGVDCTGDHVTVLMLAPDASSVPERKPSVTPSGKPTLKKRTKAELTELYVSTIASNTLATAKEAFAVAPGIQRATIAVLRWQLSAGLGTDRLEAIFCGTLTRQLLDGVDWQTVDLARVLDEVPEALIKRKGQAGELQPLDLAGESELAHVVEDTQASLEEAK